MIFNIKSYKKNKIYHNYKKIKNYLKQSDGNFYNAFFKIPFIQKPLPTIPFTKILLLIKNNILCFTRRLYLTNVWELNNLRKIMAMQLIWNGSQNYLSLPKHA